MVKKCMDFVVDGVRPRGRPKRTWKEVMEGDMKSLKLTSLAVKTSVTRPAASAPKAVRTSYTRRCFPGEEGGLYLCRAAGSRSLTRLTGDLVRYQLVTPA